MSSNQQPPNMLYPVANALASSNPFVVWFSDRDPTTADINYPIQKWWFNGTTNQFFFLKSYSSNNAILTANWVQVPGGGIAAIEFTVDSVTAPGVNPVTPDVGGNVNVSATAVAAHSVPIETRTRALNTYSVEAQFAAANATTDATKAGLAAFNSSQFSVDANGFVQATSVLTNDLHWPKFIVGDTTNGANYATITAALAAASSGDTIGIQPGTYTENLTLKDGVNIVGLQSDPYTPNVTIIGKATATFAGTCTIAGIRLQTNSDYCLSVTGSSATLINLKGCYIAAANNTAIQYTSSSGSSKIQLYDCKSEFSTTGIALFTHSGSGQLKFFGGTHENSAVTSTASTLSGSGSLSINNTYYASPITTSSTSGISINNSLIQAVMTIGGTGSNAFYSSAFITGASTAISVGTGATLVLGSSTVSSSNTNAIDGVGTINYSGVTFTGSSVKISTTTQTGGIAQGGVVQAPSAGFLGEQIRATVAKGSPVSLNNGAPATNVTSISLTAGIWDISGVVGFQGATTGGYMVASLSTTSATLGTEGDNAIYFPFQSQATTEACLTIPPWRLTITATTTIYLVAQESFTVGTGTAFGRISATRVG